jgi:hypothetical protein
MHGKESPGKTATCRKSKVGAFPASVLSGKRKSMRSNGLRLAAAVYSRAPGPLPPRR